jgi:antitoxin (DNA-binding transcriptional repressor) of toxin-antitoxin stability system
MTSLAVQDLKRPRELREILSQEREIFITKDGRPFAIMIGVDAEGADNTLREVRRAMLSAAVSRARSRTREQPISAADIEQEVMAYRKQRAS